jgi:hypothetical protein
VDMSTTTTGTTNTMTMVINTDRRSAACGGLCRLPVFDESVFCS